MPGAVTEPSRTDGSTRSSSDRRCPTHGRSSGIGLNYKSHAEESGMELPPAPLTFTKFPSCLAGPTADVPLVRCGRRLRGRARGGDRADLSRDVREESAWEVVAGVTAGQDISDREVQLTGSPPQFCLGKKVFGAYGAHRTRRRFDRLL